MKLSKKLILAVLFPALSVCASCSDLTVRGSDSKSANMTYKEAKDFVTKNFDEHALDSTIVTYKADLNSCALNGNLHYQFKDTGGYNDVGIGFNFGGIHQVVPNQYAYYLSSQLLNTIEKYNSMAESFSIELIGFQPVDLNYIARGSSMILSLGIAAGDADNFIIKLLSLLTGAMSTFQSAYGFIDVKNDNDPVYSALRKVINGSEMRKAIAYAINYADIGVNTSSNSTSDAFEINFYTDSQGAFVGADISLHSEFFISGEASMLQYESKNPVSGEKPSGTRFTVDYELTGSIDFSMVVTTEF